MAKYLARLQVCVSITQQIQPARFRADHQAMDGNIGGQEWMPADDAHALADAVFGGVEAFEPALQIDAGVLEGLEGYGGNAAGDGFFEDAVAA